MKQPGRFNRLFPVIILHNYTTTRYENTNLPRTGSIAPVRDKRIYHREHREKSKKTLHL